MADTTTPKPFVFVLMPFDKAFDDIYTLGIKGACQDVEAYCERVDEQVFTESILDRIYNQIAKSDIIIADMTRRNPNVFYETGYAHALGKQVVLLTQYAHDIPFDMKHYPHIIYDKSNIANLKAEIKRRIAWLINNPSMKIKTAELTFDFYVSGLLVSDSDTYKLTPMAISPSKGVVFYLADFQFEVHNPSKATLDLSNFQVGFAGPWVTGVRLSAIVNVIESKKQHTSLLKLSDRANLVYMPSNMTMYLFPLPNKLLPDGWIVLSCLLALEKPQGPTIKCFLRTWTELSVRDISINIEFRDAIEIK